jgi:hypothetical protein
VPQKNLKIKIKGHTQKKIALLFWAPAAYFPLGLLGKACLGLLTCYGWILNIPQKAHVLKGLALFCSLFRGGVF